MAAHADKETMTLIHYRSKLQSRCDWQTGVMIALVGAMVACNARPSSDCRTSWTCPLASVEGIAGGPSNVAGASAAWLGGMAGSGGYLLGGAAGVVGFIGISGFGNVAGASGTAGTAGAAVAAPQVKLTVAPVLRVLNGAKQSLTVSIERDGNSDRFAVRLSGLPTGVVAGEAIIDAGTSQAEVVVEDSAALSRGGPFAVTTTVVSQTNPAIQFQVVTSLYLTREAGQVDLSLGSTAMAVQKISAGGFDVPRDAAADSNGCVVLTGSGKNATGNERAWIVRLNKNGALDGAFDSERQWSEFGNPAAAARSILLKSNRLYVGVTATSGQVSFLRTLTKSGTYTNDTTFPDNTVPTALVPFGAGLLALLGTSGSLVALGPDGAPAPTWAPAQSVSATAVTTDASGRVVYGQARTDVYAIGRLTASGTGDGDFGTNGELTIHPGVGSPNRLVSLLTMPTGQIVALVESAVGNEPNETEVRLYGVTANGFVDGGFGETTSPGSTKLTTKYGNAYSAAVQPDGKIVVLYSETGTTERYLLARYAQQSQWHNDPTFAGGRALDVSAQFAGLTVGGMTYDPNGHRAVVFGNTSEGAAVLRVWL